MSDFLDGMSDADLRKEFRKLINRVTALEQRRVVVNSLDEFGTDDGGEMRDFRYLALSSGSNPSDEDATGAFMASKPEFEDSIPTNIGTVKNGVPQAGMNTDGKFYYGAMSVVCDADGEKTTGVNFLRRHDWLDGALAYFVKTGVWKPFGRTEYIYGWQYTNPSPMITEKLNRTSSATLPVGWSTGDDDSGSQSLGVNTVARAWKIQSGSGEDYKNAGYIRTNTVTITAGAVYLLDFKYIRHDLKNGAANERANFQIKVIYNDGSSDVLYDDTAVGYQNFIKQFTFDYSFIPDQTKSTFYIEFCGTATSLESLGVPSGTITIGKIDSGTYYYASITEQAAILRDVFLSSDGLDSSQGLHQESVTLLPEECLQIGLMSLTTSASQTILGYYGSRTSAAVGDVYTYKFNAKKGTYNIDITYFGSAYNGIVDCYLDGVLIDDNFNYRRSSATYNLRNTLTGKAITYNGAHELKFVVVGTAGSNYHFYHTKISLARTGD